MLNYSKENLIKCVIISVNPTSSESKISEDFLLNQNLKEIAFF